MYYSDNESSDTDKLVYQPITSDILSFISNTSNRMASLPII